MTHLPLPSEVEPETLADLVADCRSVRLSGPRRDGAEPPAPGSRHGHGRVAPITIPDGTAALVDGMPEYGD